MNTQQRSLVEFRRDILHSMDISYDYYPASETRDNHCRWVCLGCHAMSFKSFPAFKRHLTHKHGISFCEITWMR